MRRGSGFYGVFCISAVLAVFLVFSAGLSGFADFSGSWKSDAFLKSQTASLNFSSKIKLNYSSGGINYGSTTLFDEGSFSAQKFRTDFILGFLGVSSTLDFDPQAKRLDYFVTEAGTSLAGPDVGSTFVLEHADGSSTYGAGWEFEVSAGLSDVAKVYVKNLFGMEENEAEALGLVRGSGYTIQTGGPGPSSFDYVNTTVEISGLEFGCCNFFSTTRFGAKKGFEHSIFEFDLESKKFPLKLDGKLKFTPQTKSLKLDPGIDLNWACFEVYTDLSTADDEDLLVSNSDQVNSLDGLEVEGFGISGVKLGPVNLSGLVALKGKLNRLSGEDNIDLRADDYVLDPDPVYTGLYTETEYDGAISIGKNGKDSDLTFGADLYFDTGGSGSLFDSALFTGSGEYDFSDTFSLGFGAAVKPGRLEKARLSLDYVF